MSADSLEKLDKIESMLEDVVERQKISRFDTLMFLMYPAVFFCLAILINAYSSWKLLKDLYLLGWPLGFVLFGMSYVFGTVLILPLVIFIRAYVTDSLRLRIGACFISLVMTICYVFLALAIILPSPISDLARRYGDIARLVVTNALGMLIVSFIAEPIVYVEDKITLWFFENLPQRIRREGFKLKRPRIAKRVFVARKLVWLTFSLSYGTIVILAIRLEGLHGTILYHAIVLVVFLLTSTLIMAKKISLGFGNIVNR